MRAGIRRAFVRIGSRFVHYREAGSGPVLVMLHQSPQNSRMWLEQIEWLSSDFRVLAPDLPGFGHSDPLELEQPRIADLSAACHEWLDAIGVAQCAVFGMHTGGMVAVHMGLDRPHRIGLVMVDGYAIFTDRERALLGERYLPPFQPDWSGQHLRWLWARMREQSFFFPWCEQVAESALRFPAPDTAKTHAAVMDILEVGDQYRLGYRAALQFADRACVAELLEPTRLFYRQDDVLISHRERLPELPAHVSAACLPDRESLWSALVDALKAWRPAGQNNIGSAPQPGWQRRVFVTRCGEIVSWVWHPESPAEQVHLILHGCGQAPRRPSIDQAPETGASALLIQPDLPGHGASVETAVAAISLEALAQALLEVCLELAADAGLSIEAHEGSAALALALAERWPGSVQGLELVQPWLLDEAERQYLLAHLPHLSPRPAGGHLLEAWQWERERHLFPPWRPPSAENRLPGPAPDVGQVHANSVCLIGLGADLRALMSEWIRPDLASELSGKPYRISLRFDPDRDAASLAELDRQLRSRELQSS